MVVVMKAHGVVGLRISPGRSRSRVDGVYLMPWTPEDAERHTRKADTPELQRLWSEVANRVLEATGDEGRAIREANAVVARNRRGND